MCDALQEGDDKFEKSQQILNKQGCFTENKELTECLNQNGKDWRFCQVFL